jgi:hypothetical protein
MATAARAVMVPRARPDTRGAWYQGWLLTAVDGSTFTVPDTEDNEREFGRPGSGRGEGKTTYPQIQAACLVELGTHAVFDARMDRCGNAARGDLGAKTAIRGLLNTTWRGRKPGSCWSGRGRARLPRMPYDMAGGSCGG